MHFDLRSISAKLSDMKYEDSWNRNLFRVLASYKYCIFAACDGIKTDTIKPENKMAPACYRLLLTAHHQSAGKTRLKSII